MLNIKSPSSQTGDAKRFLKRMTYIENKLHLKVISKEQKFEHKLKDFKQLDTFQSLQKELHDLNINGKDPEVKEIEDRKQQNAYELYKLNTWKSSYPESLEFSQKNIIFQDNNLPTKARNRINLELVQPKVYQGLKNLGAKLQEKFKTLEMKENPQLQLFKDIAFKDPTQRIMRTEVMDYTDEEIKFHQPQQIDFDEYFEQYQKEAEQLRLKMRKRQMEFFNQKWGNSVMKMKQKDKEYRLEVKRLSTMKQSQTKMSKSMKSSIRKSRTSLLPKMKLGVEIKEILEDICFEEDEMNQQKDQMVETIKEMQSDSDKFYAKYAPKKLMGLRLK